MKNLFVFARLAISLCLLVSSAAAAEKTKKTIKEVDEKASAIKFSRQGATSEDVLAVDKSVDLKKVKASSKAEITVDGGVVKEIKPESKPRAPGY